ncbi:MAG: hypothetical protein ABJF04_19070 [Reichenbachiella sp.]|uniref:hypothetical protein n=1 Tax=Reichenbachiella sp. TaxID=2184521 RepID=UPI00326737BE
MAWGNKPWQGGTRKKFQHESPRNQERGYEHIAFDFTSQYRSKREASNTFKGFLSMIVFTGVLAVAMWGLILFIHWVGVTF